jgi:hypothetical protein
MLKLKGPVTNVRRAECDGVIVQHKDRQTQKDQVEKLDDVP